MSTDDDVRDLVASKAITEVIHRYCYYLDNKEWDKMVAEIYALDGIDDRGEGPVQGSEALHEWFENSVSVNMAASAHTMTNIVIERDGDHAVVKSQVTAWVWTRETVEEGSMRPADYVMSVGYLDELSEYPQGWRIDKRVVTWNHQSIVAAGVVPPSQAGVHALAAAS
jgi:hypothetical protein